jgi:dTDP-glucose 4,6-dehydratase
VALMHVLVTGGAGFIGSALVRRLLAEPDVTRVTTLDALTYAGRRENLEDVAGDARHALIVGDVADDAVCDRALGGGVPSGANANPNATATAGRPDVVFHLAAESHVDRSIERAAVFVTTNVQGTRALLDAARRHATPRFVHVSTDEVYGPLAAPERAREDQPFRPSSPYAVTKAAADMLAQAYHRTYTTPVTVVRMANCYGPRQFPEKLIPLSIARARAGEAIPVYGDGQQVREWMYVEDAVDGLVRAWRSGVPGDAYNVGPGEAEARPNLRVLELLLDRLARPRALLRHVEDRPGHDRRYAIDAARARAQLGWAPRTPLEEGLSRTIDWFVANQAWLRAALDSGDTARFLDAQYGRRLRPT